MTELDKLENYLKERNIPYQRKRGGDAEFDAWCMKAYGHDGGEQIIAYDDDGERSWDAICGHGSYGREQGLLEVMGSAVVRTNDSVEGWLTAEDVIERLEGRR